MRHGMAGATASQTAEYRTWKQMKIRCYNQNRHDYARYGAAFGNVEYRK